MLPPFEGHKVSGGSRGWCPEVMHKNFEGNEKGVVGRNSTAGYKDDMGCMLLGILCLPTGGGDDSAR